VFSYYLYCSWVREGARRVRGKEKREFVCVVEREREEGRERER